MTIILYSVSDDDLKVNKTLGTAIATFNDVEITDEDNIHEPHFIITLNSTYLSVNYAYIEAWHRYYFVKINILDGNRMEFILTVDRLMSFVNANKASLTGYVERNANNFNLNILDEQAVFTNDRDIKTAAVTYSGVTKAIEGWKLVGLFNAGLCNSIEEVTP